LAALFTSLSLQSQCPSNQPSVRPRVFLLSDIANEPDDAQSLVRLLTYANELRIEGLMHAIVNAYGQALPNLRIHADGWPETSHLHSLIASGLPVYGMDGVGEGRDSEGSRRLVAAPSVRPRVFLLSDIANEPDDAQSLVRLLTYANELRIEGLMHAIVNAYGQALPNLRIHADGWPETSHLHSLIASGLPVYGMDGVGEGRDSEGSRRLVAAHINATRGPAETEDVFASRIRAYAISDQDNTGAWIRRHWPRLFYIASVHHFNRYALAAWSSISGELYYNFPCLADGHVVSPSWIAANIQSAGALGAEYPDADFTVEGDTLSLLYLIPNGLSDPEFPEWGSWGGRYSPVNHGEGHYANTVDAVRSDNNACMNWGVAGSFVRGRHPPVAVVNGDRSRDVLKMHVVAGQKIVLDASRSYDPDGNQL
ncbi:hypothetical protein CSHISOI_10688, partial [Colletotrichum shisoi]